MVAAMLPTGLAGTAVAYGAEAPVLPNYVALGDSITYGVGVSNPGTQGNVALLTADLTKATKQTVTSSNRGVIGWDTTDLLTELQNAGAGSDLRNELANAKYVTLNIGSNNLLRPAMAALCHYYEVDSSENLAAYLDSNLWAKIGLLSLKLSSFSSADQQAIKDGITLFNTELPQITALIKSYAPQAKLVVATFYNPLSSLFSIYADADALIGQINQTIKSNSASGGYSVADVYSSFKQSPVTVVNSNVNTGSAVDLVHPNAAGHRNIADEYLYAFASIARIEKVVVGGDAEVLHTYLASGENKTLVNTAKVVGALEADKTVKWSVSGTTGVAKVNSKTGLVTFLGKEGKVKLIATSVQDPSISASKTITVIRNVTLMLTPLKSINIVKGKTAVLAVELYDGKIGELSVTKYAGKSFASSNKKIVTVNKNGKIKGIKTGTAKITVTAKNGLKQVIRVTVVKKAVKLKKFGLEADLILYDKDDKEIYTESMDSNRLKLGATAQLKIRLSPAKATNPKITFKSSKPKIVSVDKAGKIVAKKKGKAVITVKLGAKIVKTKTITVK
jgi:lysophospholipase L1-like esterase